MTKGLRIIQKTKVLGLSATQLEIVELSGRASTIFTWLLVKNLHLMTELNIRPILQFLNAIFDGNWAESDDG